MKRGRWIACLLPLLAVCRPEAAGAEYAAFAAAVVCGVAVPPGGMTGETEERSGAIDSVTVTARRPLSDIGIQKTVFDETLLHEDVTFSLADMLAHSTPVFIKSYGRGTMATVSLRGTGASHTRVTWNGMRMNSPLFGMMDLSYIPSYFIDGAALYNGASSVGVAGGGLGGAIALDTRPSDSDGFGMKYIQGVASYSTFDEYLRLSYGGGRMRSETSVLLTTSENDFTYRNYAKKDFVLDGNGNVTGWSYPLERNRNCSYRDFHILQELYYDAGRGGDFGLSAWYMDSSRGLPLLNTDYTESNTSFLGRRRRPSGASCGGTNTPVGGEYRPRRVTITATCAIWSSRGAVTAVRLRRRCRRGRTGGVTFIPCSAMRGGRWGSENGSIW